MQFCERDEAYEKEFIDHLLFVNICVPISCDHFQTNLLTRIARFLNFSITQHRKFVRLCKANVPVLARVPLLARLHAFLGKIKKVVNVFRKKISLLSLNISDNKLLRICL